MNVCRGDPILRRRLREHVKKEMALRNRLLLDPRESVVVVRQQKHLPFQRNVVKSVMRKPQAPVVGNVEELWTTKRTGGGKVKTRRNRPTPYKTFRL